MARLHKVEYSCFCRLVFHLGQPHSGFHSSPLPRCVYCSAHQHIRQCIATLQLDVSLDMQLGDGSLDISNSPMTPIWAISALKLSLSVFWRLESNCNLSSHPTSSTKSPPARQSLIYHIGREQVGCRQRKTASVHAQPQAPGQAGCRKREAGRTWACQRFKLQGIPCMH